ncbi:MAG: tellurite resistance/C4-dicarboxylate transporter family protein [Candidatus Dormibacterales bacterium]
MQQGQDLYQARNPSSIGWAPSRSPLFWIISAPPESLSTYIYHNHHINRRVPPETPHWTSVTYDRGMIRTRFGRGLERLHPGSFAFVMATGIVSTAELMLGRTALSLFFLVVAAIGYAVLWLLYGARLWFFPAEVWQDTGRPSRAFGFFTVVAGSNVLGVRLALAGNIGVAEGLAIVGAGTWVLLAYGVLARLVFAGAKPRAAASINGTWLIWVVATQSVSVSVSVVGGAMGVPPEAAALTATSFWAFGAVLYVILMAIILARLILLELNPIQASPPYWISMGATAITVVAGAHLLELPHQLPTILATRPVIQGVTFLLWAFGSWWIPFLVIPHHLALPLTGGAHLRADALEHGLPARHVRCRDRLLWQGRRRSAAVHGRWGGGVAGAGRLVRRRRGNGDLLVEAARGRSPRGSELRRYLEEISAGLRWLRRPGALPWLDRRRWATQSVGWTNGSSLVASRGAPISARAPLSMPMWTAQATC